MLPLGIPGSAGRPNGAVLGFEKKLWELADKLRSNMDAAEYKHVVLGLIFLKYISDVFEEKHRALRLVRRSGRAGGLRRRAGILQGGVAGRD
jgi:hypothetical protein